jgi:hypothetical protein
MSNQRSLNSSKPTLTNQNARLDGSVADHVPTLIAEDAESKTLPNQVQTMRGGPASRIEPPPTGVIRSEQRRVEPPPTGVIRSEQRRVEPPPTGVIRSIEPPPTGVIRGE